MTNESALTSTDKFKLGDECFDWDATADDIKSKLEAFSGISAVDVKIIQMPPEFNEVARFIHVEFVNADANSDKDELKAEHKVN